jgi:putative phosphoribosyl transferase
LKNRKRFNREEAVYFRNRTEAGHFLAASLHDYRGRADALVLGLPRGGVPVAHQVAGELGAPLDVFVVRKLGVPGQEELAMGAIATGGVRILHEGVIRELGIPSQIIDLVTAKEQQELERREYLYRGTRDVLEIEGRTVIVVDDGVATGSTMKAALATLRRQKPARLIVAVPTAPAETCAELRTMADEVICLATPDPFYSVGGSYADFTPTTDEEVRDILRTS